MQSINPANNQILWEGNISEENTVHDLVQKARDALENWCSLGYQKRLKYINNFKKELEKEKEILAEIISMETGKPLWESLAEVGAMINKIAISAKAFEERCLETSIPFGDSAESATRFKPHGVAAVFGPYNFPGHLPNGHIIPALLAGNTVVFKPSELTPYTAEKTFNIWEKSGLPAGVINLIQGKKETGIHLASANINALYFTGSSETGKLLKTQFTDRPEVILALEMGGNNPLIVWDAANTKAIIQLIILSAFITTGQRCTCARRLILPNNAFGEHILHDLKIAVTKLIIGDFSQKPEPFMGPLISAEAANHVFDSYNHLIKNNAKIILEMKHVKKSAFLTPGILDVSQISQKEDTEIFGPLLQVIRVDTFEAAIKEANATQYGLSAGLISDKEKLWQQFYNQSTAGIINWNRQTTGASSSSPFGGMGASGNNRPGAFFAADYCSYPVATITEQKIACQTKLPPGIDI